VVNIFDGLHALKEIFVSLCDVLSRNVFIYIFFS